MSIRITLRERVDGDAYECVSILGTDVRIQDEALIVDGFRVARKIGDRWIDTDGRGWLSILITEETK